jgi:ABC-type lipoprotein release transport system permease subunit
VLPGRNTGTAVPRRTLRSLLFEVSPNDPVTVVAVASFLFLAALAASYFPARRGASFPGQIREEGRGSGVA